MTQYGYKRFSKQRFFRGALLITLILGLQILCTSKPAHAHVTLVRVEPVDGERLATTPPEAQFWFSEAIVPQFSDAQLLDEANQVVAGTSVYINPAEPTVMHVMLPTLKQGGYTLFWKALSEADGHSSQGFSSFSIGQNAPTVHSAGNAAATSFSTWPSLVESGLRWANFLFLACLVGALAIVRFGLVPLEKQPTAQAAIAQQALQRRLFRWAAICAATLWCVGLGLLIWQVALSQTAVSAQAAWPAQARSVLTQTHWGALWIVRQALLLFVSGGLWWLAGRWQPSSSSWSFLIIAGRTIDLLIVQALTGHALSSGANWLLALANDTVHLLAASLWMGGLITLVVLVLPAVKWGTERAPGWRTLNWGAFSRLAALSVGLLVVSGFFSMGEQVASLDALLTTVYGRLLLGKLGLVLLAAFCGLLNTLLVHPRLAAPLARRLGRPPGWTPLSQAALPRLIGLEVALGVLIFALTGFLTASPPPRGVEFTLTPADIPHSLGQRVDQLFVTLEVTPNRPGRNLFSIRAVVTQPTPASEISQVLLRFRDPNGNRSPIEAFALFVSPGLYQVTGNYLPSSGPWQIEVVTSRPHQPDTVASFAWTVAPPGGLTPAVWSKQPLAHWFTLLAGCCLLLLGLAVVSWRWWASRPPLNFAVARDERVGSAEAVVPTQVYRS